MHIGYGFLFADGCLGINNLSLSLSAKDHEHICKFANYIGGNVRKEAKNGKAEMHSVSKHNINLTPILNSFGIIKNKTYKQQKCPIFDIPEDLRHSWLAGYFDRRRLYFNKK